MNKWEVDEHEQWSEKVRSQRFCPPLLDKNRNYDKSSTRVLKSSTRVLKSNTRVLKGSRRVLKGSKSVIQELPAHDVTVIISATFKMCYEHLIAPNYYILPIFKSNTLI